MLYSFKTSNASKSNLLKSEHYLRLGRALYQTGKIDKAYLIGTGFEDIELNTVSQNELEAFFYRQAIRFNPNEAEAINELGMCIAYGALLKEEDIKGTPFEGQPLNTLNREAIQTALYRKAITLNPLGVYFYFNLAQCLKDEKIALDLIDIKETRFRGQLLEGINRVDLRAELFRKELSLNPYNNRAILELALCIGLGASIVQSDLHNTPLNNKHPKDISSDNVMTELYRKAIYIKNLSKTSMQAEDMNAFLYLAFHILKGTPCLPQDLQGTRFEGQPLSEISSIEIAAELFRKVLAFYAPNRHYPALRNLSICVLNGASLQECDLSYSPFEGTLLKSVNSKEWALWVENLEEANYSNVFKNSLRQEIEHLEIEISENITHPDEFICPITREVMKEPVFICDNTTYEKLAIQEWFKTKLTSPLTNEVLSRNTLLPNFYLQIRIIAYLKNLRKNVSEEQFLTIKNKSI